MCQEYEEEKPLLKRPLESLSFDAAAWTKGLWADKFELCRQKTLPAVRDAMDVPGNGAAMINFRMAAGEAETLPAGRPWSDGDCYKWIEAVTNVYGITGDEELEEVLNDFIALLERAQEPDGYIHTHLGKADRWQASGNHELYNFGHLITAACVHKKVTGKDNFLRIACKAADYLYGVFCEHTEQPQHCGHNPSHIMALVDLYRLTEEERYLRLAETFVDLHGRLGKRTDQEQNRVPFREEEKAVGHAVLGAYLYCGATDVFRETGEEELWTSISRIWRNMTTAKTYIHGGIGSLHEGISERGDVIHEAFGRDYQLPNSTAYCETCANIAGAMWNRRLLQLTGDARHADLMERSLYNSMLSGLSADGEHFFYTNPLRWYGEQHKGFPADRGTRWHTFNCFCCPPSIARTLTGLHEWAYSFGEGALWVNLYGGSKVETTLPDGTDLKVTQKTEYPWDGRISFTIEKCSAEVLPIKLRIPGWVSDATVSINDEPIETSIEGGCYFEVKHSWSPGDELTLHMPLQVRMVAAHPKVEETRNQVAIFYGPVLYCLESVDLPDDIDISEIHIPRDIDFVPNHYPDLLGGITVLEGEAQRISREGETAALYTSLNNAGSVSVPVRLIPYFSRANRGDCEMTVWLPCL